MIGTLTGHISAESVDAAKELLSAAMTSLAALVSEAGGVIGHIKAIVSEEGRGYQISVTEDEAVVRSLMPSAYRAECAAIVFAVEEEALRAYISETLGKLIVPDEDDDCCEDECCDGECCKEESCEDSESGHEHGHDHRHDHFCE